MRRNFPPPLYAEKLSTPTVCGETFHPRCMAVFWLLGGEEITSIVITSPTGSKSDKRHLEAAILLYAIFAYRACKLPTIL